MRCESENHVSVSVSVSVSVPVSLPVCVYEGPCRECASVYEAELHVVFEWLVVTLHCL